jgi:di/tricarboxylate transporter
MVMAPGGYRPRDFLRYGGAMTVVVALVAIGLLSIR